MFLTQTTTEFGLEVTGSTFLTSVVITITTGSTAFTVTTD
jgi:hypothetical protein